MIGGLVLYGMIKEKYSTGMIRYVQLSWGVFLGGGPDGEGT